MTPIIQKQTGPTSNPAMAFELHKYGRILEATVKVKKATVTADVDIAFLLIAAVMISLVNVIYLVGIF